MRGLHSPTRIKSCLSSIYAVSDSVSFVGSAMKRLVRLLFGGSMLIVEVPSSYSVLCVWYLAIPQTWSAPPQVYALHQKGGQWIADSMA